VVEFPDYAALARPTPLSIVEVQAQLNIDEDLVLFLDTDEWKPTPEETFIWIVTKRDMRWVRSDLGAEALKGEVATLRCGLDEALWNDDDAARDLAARIAIEGADPSAICAGKYNFVVCTVCLWAWARNCQLKS